VYRLLDAKVCFHRGLPGPGSVIRYDIHIDHFFRQGNTWLFRFHFESTVNGEPLLTMTEGCAGFFSAGELAGGKGIIRTAMDLKPTPGKRPADWVDLVAMGVECYSAEQLDALRAGDFQKCFGAQFAKLSLHHPVTLPSGRMRLVHRIPHLDPVGGRFGMGLIRGEADIHPNDWFLTCHFVDDRVMPGTLMYECCMHTLRVFLLRMGWVAEQDQAALEPMPGVVSQLKCRGQVLETTSIVTYEVSIKEMGFNPEPFVIADALMYADGKPIVEIINMSLRYAGSTRQMLRDIWASAKNLPSSSRGNEAQEQSSEFKVRSSEFGVQEAGEGNQSLLTSAATVKKTVLYDYERILAFAIGKPSDAFGAPYEIFNERRRIARLPGPPYQFLDRITEVQGEPFKMVAGGVAEAEYDVPPDAWYFAENRQGDMAFAVLLEIALQPCGWLAAYLGSALTSETDLSFRNLGGNGNQFLLVYPDTGTLTTRVKMTRVSSSAGMIIQWFDMEVHAKAGLVYKGDTYFGFFPKSALEHQEGIHNAKLYQPSEAEMARSQSLDYPQQPPYAGEQLRMADRIDVFIPDGGPHKLGFIRGTKRVRPEEWFFKAHFYQDPVVPGSLGLESYLQLLKFLAIQRWGHQDGMTWEAVAIGQPHEWVYRGQIIPTDHLVTIEAEVTAINDEARLLTADGFLSVDGRVIYGMKHFTVRQQKIEARTGI
jgi:3-hydroxymyristoyl/3-hydroxydecanoyl-(acyl carrier protein) dehydratase